jgi:hypothetical protein
MAEEKKSVDFKDDGTENFEDNPTENTSKTEEQPKKVQSSKENAKFKQMRLEQEEKIKKDAYEKGQIDALGTNPYTGKPIRDQDDLDIYKIQKKLEEDQKDPIQDLPEAMASRNRETREKANKEKEANDELQKRAQKDLEDFYAAGYSKEDLNNFLKELESDEWKDFFGDSIATGHMSPAKAYKAMQKIKGNISEEVKKKEEAKKIATPPSPTGSNKVSKSIEEMTQKEINELYNQRFKKTA